MNNALRALGIIAALAVLLQSPILTAQNAVSPFAGTGAPIAVGEQSPLTGTQVTLHAAAHNANAYEFALIISLGEGWRTYGKATPATASTTFPPSFDWQTDPQISLAFPPTVPITVLGQPIQGYLGEVILPISPALDMSALNALGSKPVATVLSCSDAQCIPERFALDAEIAIQQAGTEQPTWSKDTAVQKSRVAPALLTIMLFALLGGLILNVMPCVLPVLLLKVAATIEAADKTHPQIRRQFLATALGIVLSFLVLGLILLAIRSAGGSALGWGFQFQNPWFLGGMIVVLLGFAVNLLGWWHISLPRAITRLVPKTAAHSNKAGFRRSMLEGSLMTLLATPCTAPFVGVAVGFALAAPAWQMLVILVAMGIGLALPMLLFACAPSLVQHLPRPGKWMLTIRRLLAVGLVGMAVWLASLLLGTTADATESYPAPWVAFESARIVELVDAGTTVYIDFTADWCLTCKVNAVRVYDDAFFAQHPDVVFMRGDWTLPNAEISEFLREHQRAGIPFNVVYSPRTPTGLILPELLTRTAIDAALKP